ncbi:hypothetical protein, partial [Microcoleus sp. OTE_8_concoct_300]|uniref:hypothetical protein n=1 Tax=Microcoleus sp. OTE_8_concoct_300 TaxID=2964710 RepID=UPI00403F227F
IILKETRESYWGNLELHPRIQPTNQKKNGDWIIREIVFLCPLQKHYRCIVIVSKLAVQVFRQTNEPVQVSPNG